MENKKDYLEKLINKTIKEIDTINKSNVDDKNTIEEISCLMAKLKDIKVALEPKQKTLNKRISNLNSILGELTNIKFDLMLSRQDEMFNVIERNLLDGMSLKSIDETINIRSIMFEGVNVGSIEVLEESKPDIKIRVTVYNNTDEFNITDTLKMYSIISFINTKFNYKQE